MGHKRPIGRTAAALTLLLVGVAGCSSAGAKAVGSPPEARVANQYMGALMLGDLNRAAKYVAPSQRKYVKRLVQPSGPASPVVLHGAIHVARTTRHGNNATVVFVGHLCKSARHGHRHHQHEQCVSNHKSTAASPIFTVHLERQGKTWRVVYPKPTSGPGVSQGSSSAHPRS